MKWEFLNNSISLSDMTVTESSDEFIPVRPAIFKGFNYGDES
jgi:hypothetical protein